MEEVVSRRARNPFGAYVGEAAVRGAVRVSRKMARFLVGEAENLGHCGISRKGALFFRVRWSPRCALRLQIVSNHDRGTPGVVLEV